jgi:FkbM family methyltransferase
MDKYPYIRTLIKTQLNQLKRINTIIDIGAYTGDYAKELALTYPSAIVHAIEPYNTCTNIIREKCNVINNIKIHELAIEDYNGNANLYYEEKSNPEKPSLSSSISSDAKTNNVNACNVKCVSLFHFCEINNIKEIDLLLINAEGSEYNIFLHEPSQIIIKNTKIIDLSLHGKSFLYATEEYSKKRCSINKFLKKSGFELLYGEYISDPTIIHTKHIRQVWRKTGAFAD